jgi:hypothetical protein
MRRDSVRKALALISSTSDLMWGNKISSKLNEFIVIVRYFAVEVSSPARYRDRDENKVGSKSIAVFTIIGACKRVDSVSMHPMEDRVDSSWTASAATGHSTARRMHLDMQQRLEAILYSKRPGMMMKNLPTI